jgi:hypothetical protein
MIALSYVCRVAIGWPLRPAQEKGIGVADARDDPTDNAWSWDVRSVRYVDDATARRIVNELLAGNSQPSAVLPSVVRLGPATSSPWVGTLHVTHIPVGITARKANAVGFVEVMPVGAGTTEIRICLVGQTRAHRAHGYRRLRDLAERAGDQLLRADPTCARPDATIPPQRAAKSHGEPVERAVSLGCCPQDRQS